MTPRQLTLLAVVYLLAAAVCLIATMQLDASDRLRHGRLIDASFITGITLASAGLWQTIVAIIVQANR